MARFSFRRLFGFEEQAVRSSRPRSHVRLRLEALEDRLVPAVHDLTTHMDYTTIQAAVNAANPGDRLLADAGSYAESVTINKQLTLEGARHGVDARTRAGAESIVDGTGNGGKTPFTVAANGVIIDGFTVQGATNANLFGAGVYLQPGTHGTHFINNIVQNNIVGLFVSNNSATDPTVVQHNLFENNTKPGPSGGTDIYADEFTAGVGGVNNVLIDSNKFTNAAPVENTWALGISNTASTPFTHITFSNNTVTNHGRGVYFFDSTAVTISGNSFTGATHFAIGAFGGVNGVTITCNTIQNSKLGLFVEDDLGSPSTPDANSNIKVNHNNFVGNTQNILVSKDGTSPNGYTGTLDATNNWWGSPSGPASGSIVDNVSGSSVNFTPWLRSPADCNDGNKDHDDKDDGHKDHDDKDDGHKDHSGKNDD